MPKSNIEVVIDCAEPSQLGKFWREALATGRIGPPTTSWSWSLRRGSHHPSCFNGSRSRRRPRTGHMSTWCAATCGLRFPGLSRSERGEATPGSGPMARRNGSR